MIMIMIMMMIIIIIIIMMARIIIFMIVVHLIAPQHVVFDAQVEGRGGHFLVRHEVH
jgi:hypothetical protein